MAIEGAGLFTTQKVSTQDESFLKERWQQDGSVIKNIAADVSVDATEYTVTAGKRLYISSMVFSINVAFNGEIGIRDGAPGDARIYLYVTSLTQGLRVFDFPVPIYFDTSIYFDATGGAGSGSITFQGWEE